MLQVMDGMVSWVSSAWWQLAIGATTLAALATIAPLAGAAAVVAWTSHFVLVQVITDAQPMFVIL